MVESRAAVYLFWGERFLAEASRSVRSVRDHVDVPCIAITDKQTSQLIADHDLFDRVVVAPFARYNLLEKSTLWEWIPKDVTSVLFLDTDTVVLEDISFGFERAEEFGIAAAMAPHYSLSDFFGFERVMKRAGVLCRGQMQYNTGVLFLHRTEEVDSVMALWRRLCAELAPACSYKNDQPFFTLAVEHLNFNVYTLSPAYNYRAHGELASGRIRVWHSHAPLPPGVNSYSDPWPPRRFRGSNSEV